MRNFALNLGLALASSLLALLIAEGAIRLLAPIYTPPLDYSSTARIYQYDPLLGWRLIPGAQGEWIGKEFRSPEVINSLGMRDREYTVAKPSGTRRIVVVGDSLVEAVQVPIEKVFTEVLEERLNQLGSGRYEVLNLGVSGYNTPQYALLLSSDVRRYEPDLVVLVLYLGNDIWGSVPEFVLELPGRPTYSYTDGQLVLHSANPEGVCVGCPPVRHTHWLREHSALYQYVRQNALARRVAAALGRELAGTDYAAKFIAPLRVESTPEAEEAFVVTRLLLQQSDALVKSWGTPLLIVLAPDRSLLDEANWHRYLATYPKLKGYQYEFNKAQRLLLAACATDGLWCLDLSPAIQEALDEKRRPYFRYDDAHWTEEGHQIVAERLLPAIAAVILR